MDDPGKWPRFNPGEEKKKEDVGGDPKYIYSQASYSTWNENKYEKCKTFVFREFPKRSTYP
jgi:hypothetical protein